MASYLYVTIKNTFHIKKQQLSADLNLSAKKLQLDTYQMLSLLRCFHMTLPVIH